MTDTRMRPRQQGVGGRISATTRTVRATTQLVRSGLSTTTRTTRLVVHRAGWSALVLLAGMLLLALAWGWVEAAAITCFVAVAALIALAVVFVPVTFRVRVDFEQSRVVVGRVSVAYLTVTASRRGSRATVVNVPVGELTASFLVPPLGPRETWREPFIIPTERRQVLTLGPAAATRVDPLGLLSRDTILSNKTELYVHPRTLAPDYSAIGLLRDLEGEISPTISPSDIAFHSLRDYAPGDDRRHVHWPTSARLGRLVVREFEQTRRSEHLVVLDLRRDSYDGEEAAELALSAACSYGVEAISLGRSASVRFGETEMPLTTAMRLLDAASDTKFVAEGPALDELVHAGLRERPQASAVTIITGERIDSEEIARAVRTVPLSARPLVLRTAAGGRVVRGRIADAPAFTFAQLSDLRRISGVMVL
ncbi:DUF58 domain-containing protein [Gulosibacter hominis]|uniref:DUF58 domain-containing protein n=1 Tax=Gulosibacter hominis TaxID=2770504 RepID=UPI001919333D|nr:DUF58 domain-containing protein [Gulosibacter hominis]